jgi:hypothetical protein
MAVLWQSKYICQWITFLIEYSCHCQLIITLETCWHLNKITLVAGPDFGWWKPMGISFVEAHAHHKFMISLYNFDVTSSWRPWATAPVAHMVNPALSGRSRCKCVHFEFTIGGLSLCLKCFQSHLHCYLEEVLEH